MNESLGLLHKTRKENRVLVVVETCLLRLEGCWNLELLKARERDRNFCVGMCVCCAAQPFVYSRATQDKRNWNFGPANNSRRVERQRKDIGYR